MAPVSEGADSVSQPVPSAPGSSDVPAVVAVMVLHQPEAASGSVAPWSETALLALAAQDYPNLQYLVLVTGRPDTAAAGPITDAVGTALPTAVVRFLGANPGFGPACNTVLELVDGDAGFFCLLHDDVALAPDAITRLVEELYRTNAGLVGPKLVDWDEPTLLQHVGVQVDRLGERDPIVDVGEKDQEQHDAVRDVFVLPTACMLVRADLFRTIGGFEATLPLVGDDLDMVIGDVMGKGVPAGLLMTLLRGMLRAEVLSGLPPDRILHDLNRLAQEDLAQSHRFVTLFYSDYDPLRRRLRFANAAHNPPLLWRRQQGRIDRLDAPGLLIGLQSEADYGCGEVLLEPGDVLLYYTDGVTEASGFSGERFEEERLLRAFHAACRSGMGAQALLDQLFLRLDRFIGPDHPLDDDASMVVLRVREEVMLPSFPAP